jgi:hypothetical protein
VLVIYILPCCSANIAQCSLTILQLIVNCLQDQLITADTVLGILDSGPGDLANLHRQKFLGVT